MTKKLFFHIDTLYLYYNDNSYETYKYFLYHVERKKYKLLTHTGTHYVYEIPQGKLLVAYDYDLTKRMNNYNLILEFSSEYLMQNELFEIDLFFHVIPSFQKHLILFKRIDFTYTVHDPKNELNFRDDLVMSEHFKKIGEWKNSEYYRETLYLGKRATGKIIRIYNKTKELHDVKNFNKEQILFNKFGTIDNLWQVELELNRKYLKDRCDINSWNDISKLMRLQEKIFDSLKFFKNTPANILKIRNKNHGRIRYKKHFKKENAFFDFLPVKKYDKNINNVSKKVITILKQYHDKEDISFLEVSSLMNVLVEQLEENRILEFTLDIDKIEEMN